MSDVLRKFSYLIPKRFTALQDDLERKKRERQALEQKLKILEDEKIRIAAKFPKDTHGRYELRNSRRLGLTSELSKILQHESFVLRNFGFKSSDQIPRMKTGVLLLSSKSDVERSMESYGTGEHVEVVFGKDTDLYAPLKRFLHKFGHTVKYFSCSYGEGVTWEEWFEDLKWLLYLMPNLEMFRLRMKSCLELNSEDFPLMGSLVALEFDNVHHSLISAAVTTNDVQVLRIINCWDFDLGVVVSSTLSRLSATFFTVEDVLKLGSMVSPLYEATIQVDCWLSAVQLSKLFTMLRRFVLRSLRLSLRCPVHMGATLVLPELEKLEIYVEDGVSFNFLHNLQRLRELRVHLIKEQTVETGELYTILSKLDSLESSNIWQSFPKLELTKVTTYYGERKKTYRTERPPLGVRVMY